MSALNSWKEEKRSAYLYRVMAACELDVKRKGLFLGLAAAADAQALIWEKQMAMADKNKLLRYQPDVRTRFVVWLIERLGTQRLRIILAAMKVRGMSIYSDVEPTNPLPPQAPHVETWHKSVGSGGNLRAAVFGINDGLLSNASLIFGIAGANVDSHFIVLSGVAGFLAGASSMAAGEYISVRSQRELFERQIDLERSELQLYPQEEADELALIYQARGLSKAEAQKVAEVLISKPEKALDILAREELGLNPTELSSPWGAAISSFISFSVGALIPLLPFILGSSRWNLSFTIGLTAVALFSIGATLSLFTNRNALISGLRMLGIGVAAGCLTFGIGKILGVTLNI